MLTFQYSLLADEVALMNQYVEQSELCSNWGCNRLFEDMRKQAIDEMLCVGLQLKSNDQGSVNLPTKILKLEDGPIHWTDIHPAQIELVNYMTSQT